MTGAERTMGAPMLRIVRADRIVEIYRDGQWYELRSYDGKGHAVQHAPLSADEALAALATALRKATP